MSTPPPAAARAPESSLVLIVEDDRQLRVFYRDALLGAGFRVAEAHNGLQALDKATELLPALVVTDLAIPGIDGFELCRQLKSRQVLAHVPILGITGHSLLRTADERARRAGCDKLLTKPLAAETLVAEIERLLQETGRGAPPGGAL